MGTWGVGNFEDDNAIDWLAGEVDRLVRFVEQQLREQDETKDASITAAVHVIALLCESTPILPPERNTVERWRQSYLVKWDQYIESLDPDPGFQRSRRRVIEQTFDRLMRADQSRD